MSGARTCDDNQLPQFARLRKRPGADTGDATSVSPASRGCGWVSTDPVNNRWTELLY